MATIQEYLDAAKGAIISGAPERAISICQHVIGYFPKHVEANCLLAEALREKGDTAAAEDLFLRVLSADPERLIARWALSILNDERGERKAALAHLQSALEVAPDHQELRKEVVRLSGQRAKLTAGGLARIYLRAGLFDRAVAELRSLLETAPARLDVLVGLAEAYWRAGRFNEAEEVCRRALAESPDCLKALVLLGLCGVAQHWDSVRLREVWDAAAAVDPENHLLQTLATEADIELAEFYPLSRSTALSDPTDTSLLPRLPMPAAPVSLDAGRDGVASESNGAESEHGTDGSSRAAAARMGFAARSGADQLEGPEFQDELADFSKLIDEADYARFAEGKETNPDAGARRVEVMADELPLPNDIEATQGAVKADEMPPVPADGQSAAAEDGSRAGDNITNDIVAEQEDGQAESEQPAPDSVADGVPDWMPGPSYEGPVSTHEEVDETSWSQWADLLGEEITLDPEAEARLSAALAELQPQGHDSPAGSARDVEMSGARERTPVDAPPVDPTNRLSVAGDYFRAGKLDAAVAEYRALLLAAPHMNDAIASGLQDVLRQVPDNAQARRALGDAYMKAGHFQQAIDEYGRALSIEKARR